MIITLPAIVESISTRRDKTIRVTLGTREMNHAEAATLLGFTHKECYVAIKEEDFTKKETEAIDSLKTEKPLNVKSKSQRLRAALFVLWEHNNEGYTSSEDFYDRYMERFIDDVKFKIDQLENAA